MTTLSIVIPFYNRVEELMRCVGTLGASMTNNAEIIIQDDASPAVNLDGLFPPGIVQRNPVNIGFTGNANAGASRAACDVIGFVNQDVFAAPQITAKGWDATLLVLFDDPQVGIAAPRLLFENGSVQSVGGTFDQRSQPAHKCLSYANPGVLPETSTRQEVEWTTGAALFIRRELFWHVGGFDMRYAPAYFEDVDLCMKVRELGYKIIVEPAATFVHKTGTSGGSPHFAQSAHRFKEVWVDSGKVKPGNALPIVRFW